MFAKSSGFENGASKSGQIRQNRNFQTEEMGNEAQNKAGATMSTTGGGQGERARIASFCVGSSMTGAVGCSGNVGVVAVSLITLLTCPHIGTPVSGRALAECPCQSW